MVETLQSTTLGLFVIAMAAGVFSRLGLSRKFSGQLQLLLSVVLILSLVSPLLPLLKTWQSYKGMTWGSETSADMSASTRYEMETIAYAKKEAEISLLQILYARTGIPLDALEVDLTLDDRDVTAVTITAATVTVKGYRYRLMSEKIEAHVRELLFCPCEVKLEKGGMVH